MDEVRLIVFNYLTHNISRTKAINELKHLGFNELEAKVELNSWELIEG